MNDKLLNYSVCYNSIMSYVYSYNYDNAKLDVLLMGGWKLKFSFRDGYNSCVFVNVITITDPDNNISDSIYDPEECIFGPPFFFLDEALKIIDIIANGSDPDCDVPKIYALLLPITVVSLSYDSIRLQLEQKYNCKLTGKIWNRKTVCPVIYCLSDNDSDGEIDWDKEFPVEPIHQHPYLLQKDNPSADAIITCPKLANMLMFDDVPSTYYSYRRYNSTWMANNSDIFIRFISHILEC